MARRLAEVTLGAGAAGFVTSGGRDVDLSRILPTPTVTDGEHVRLLDGNGDELGLGIADLDNDKLRVFATPSDDFGAIDGALVGWRVERAYRLRVGLALAGGGDPDAVYRLIHGAGDGLPGFGCDVYGRWGVLYAYGAGLMPLARQVAQAAAGFARLRGVVVKLRRRGGSAEVTQEIVGDAPPDAVIAREHGVSYEVHLSSGLNVGLFTDMREHRRALARLAAGRRVLNLFSYTGALSLACARAGAASVTSVDTSPGVHAWAQANFARSDFAAEDRRWRWESGDAERFCVRGEKERERYDLVLIDPPTYSPAKGAGGWSLERDYPGLIARAAALVPDGGLLWLAANSHDLRSLPALADKGLRLSGRSAAVLEVGGLPPDYPTLAAQPRDRYLQVCLLRP